jgi:Uma2 family endonuclease
VAVPVEEYLSTAYHPDVDYIGGHLEECNVGERTRHIAVPNYIPAETAAQGRALHRNPIAIVCRSVAYEKEPDESIFTKPPVLCIEILSPEDRMSRVMNVVQDYLSMGVPTVWVLDPLEKKAYVADAAVGFREVTGEIATTGQQVALTLEEIFSDEDLF